MKQLKLEYGKEVLVGQESFRINEKTAGLVKYFFTLKQITRGGFLKGMLRIHDKHTFLHDRRLLISPYRHEPERVPRLINMECLISVKETTLQNPIMLRINFLEKVKPVDR